MFARPKCCTHGAIGTHLLLLSGQHWRSAWSTPVNSYRSFSTMTVSPERQRTTSSRTMPSEWHEQLKSASS
uniref:Putative secreted protein n=1 Tax=Anopheles darlingi TaxID=43151 RepID=A0A2M4DDK3_ANODA